MASSSNTRHLNSLVATIMYEVLTIVVLVCLIAILWGLHHPTGPDTDRMRTGGFCRCSCFCIRWLICDIVWMEALHISSLASVCPISSHRALQHKQKREKVKLLGLWKSLLSSLLFWELITTPRIVSTNKSSGCVQNRYCIKAMWYSQFTFPMQLTSLCRLLSKSFFGILPASYCFSRPKH